MRLDRLKIKLDVVYKLEKFEVYYDNKLNCFFLNLPNIYTLYSYKHRIAGKNSPCLPKSPRTGYRCWCPLYSNAMTTPYV